MAKRDPNKTARNRIIEIYKVQLRELLPKVLRETGTRDEQSLNAILGSKNDEFFDLKNDVIHSQDQFVNRWLHGLKKAALAEEGGAVVWIWKNLKKHNNFRRYTLLFLERSYLKHFDELSKNRPLVEAAEVWIGQENANYGLLVSPRFRCGQWENDKSEIRSFQQAYWSIGHVMQTGLVIPGKDKIFKFTDIDQYLMFFQDTLVRNSGSKYEYEIAGHYCDFVRGHRNPEGIPLLIPEFRYAGLAKKHVYRLDFLIINPYTLDKTGFELSPWSTHGYLSKIGNMSQAQINKMAADNFEKEMKKHRAFFREHDVVCLIFPDDQLKHTNRIFTESMIPCLTHEKPEIQLSFQIMEEFLEGE
ncbi:MAG TPA: topoisomerase [Candidatus Angelobacter sp.]|nr:topoisomerase [Candidatus Angelobacter sp.]